MVWHYNVWHHNDVTSAMWHQLWCDVICVVTSSAVWLSSVRWHKSRWRHQWGDIISGETSSVVRHHQWCDIICGVMHHQWCDVSCDVPSSVRWRHQWRDVIPCVPSSVVWCHALVCTWVKGYVLVIVNAENKWWTGANIRDIRILLFTFTIVSE